MNYEFNYGAQRVALARLCKQTDVQTYENGAGRKVQRPVQVLRAALFERLHGPDWGYIEWTSATEFDRMLTRAVATGQGDHGMNLRLSQHHLRCGKMALAEAMRLQSRNSKRASVIEWKLQEAKVNFQKAKEYQDKQEGSNEQN
ncbi:hypothetical protein LL998_10895 [Burkholderia ambifaria]|uniref:hypothetical protein n=1 Tax=Burkholderia ambifaria TaxID=152480 RepID=UPI001E43312A|nr:hypothetical protein [Burkholderia ambifaria]UEP33721.1 hypothetical protein LL998_10895 [Burkholderia ambifaria]